VVAALRKWAGVIGFQPVRVTTDHRALIDWVTEHVDTPSGPRGRRARWHETFSQFDITIEYVKGEDNMVPDALSRLQWQYPADSAREDVTSHGSLAAREEIKAMEAQEMEQARIRATFVVSWKEKYRRLYGVRTRGGKNTTNEPEEEEAEESPEEEEERPPRTRAAARREQNAAVPSRVPEVHPPKPAASTTPTRFEFAKPAPKPPPATSRAARGEVPPKGKERVDRATSSWETNVPP